MEKQNSIVLIDTPDQPGLIYHITKVIFDHHLNIIQNNEFVEKSEQHFFMRTQIQGPCQGSLLERFKEVLPPTSNIFIFSEEKIKLVILVTKEHHCLGDLLIRNAYHDLNIEIMAVIANHETLRPLATQFNIPFYCISHENISKMAHEHLILTQIQQFSPDYIVLAKYMRILSPHFVRQYPNRIINIHHSFLPAFVGANPYKQAFDRGVKIVGATAHFVNDDLDEGPIIVQEVMQADHSLSVEEMKKSGRDAERLALSKALKLISERRVFIRKNKTILFE